MKTILSGFSAIKRGTAIATLVILLVLSLFTGFVCASDDDSAGSPIPGQQIVYIANSPEQLNEMIVHLSPGAKNRMEVLAVRSPPEYIPDNTSGEMILYKTEGYHGFGPGASVMDPIHNPVPMMMLISIYGGALLLLIILYGAGRRFSAGYKVCIPEFYAGLTIASYLVLAGLLLLSSYVLTGSALEAIEITAFLLWIALFFQLYLGISSLALAYSVHIREAFPVIHLFHIVLAALALIVTHSLEYFSGGRIIPDLYVSAFLLLSIALALIHYRTFQKIELAPVREMDKTNWKPDENDTFIGGEETTRTLNNTGFPVALEEKYRDLDMVGRGGAARVYTGIRMNDQKQVAIKVPAHFDEKTGISFLKEMRNWKDLVHSNIVRVYTANILPVPYVEMEYVPHSLDEWRRPSPVSLVIQAIQGVGEGLLYAHNQGIVHLDIKPRNILIDENGRAKITDWGLSRLAGDSNDTTMIAFSLNYASPEQISPKQYGRADARTDIYQLGVVMYEFITGQQPFAGEGVGEVTSAILSLTPPPPSVSDPTLSPFDALLTKALAKRPDDRYQTIEEMLQDLKDAYDAYCGRN